MVYQDRVILKPSERAHQALNSASIISQQISDFSALIETTQETIQAQIAQQVEEVESLAPRITDVQTSMSALSLGHDDILPCIRTQTMLGDFNVWPYTSNTTVSLVNVTVPGHTITTATYGDFDTFFPTATDGSGHGVYFPVADGIVNIDVNFSGNGRSGSVASGTIQVLYSSGADNVYSEMGYSKDGLDGLNEAFCPAVSCSFFVAANSHFKVLLSMEWSTAPNNVHMSWNLALLQKLS